MSATAGYFLLLVFASARSDQPHPPEHNGTLPSSTSAAYRRDIPKFGEPLANLTITVGRDAMFTCVVEDLGIYKVAWLRVDTQTILTIHTHVITKNHRVVVTHTDHRTWYLNIKEIRESDRGWYMCQINTDPMKSQMAFLEVNVPPNILDSATSTDMVVREGSAANFRCSASGSPTPSYSWKRERGVPFAIQGRPVVTIEGPTFNISRVSRLHMGAYLCIASNGVPPTVSKRITLLVHFPPMIQISNQLVGAMEGEDIVLECDSEAFPKSINYWTNSLSEVLSLGLKFIPEFNETLYKTKMSLVIRNVSQADYGVYTCVSKNSLGETDGSIKVYRIPRPTTTVATTVSTTTTTTTRPTTTMPQTRAPRRRLEYDTIPDVRKTYQENELSLIPGLMEQPARSGSINHGSLHEGKMEKSSYGGTSGLTSSCLLLGLSAILALRPVPARY